MRTKLKFPAESCKILKNIYLFSVPRHAKLYLVGGALRDLILNRKKDNPDFDFAIKRGAIGFGRALAKHWGAGFVVLDKEHGSCRVVKDFGPLTYTFDFSDFRGKTIQEDLLHRDFSINSLGVELSKLFASDIDLSLIDCYGAREDLKNKVIRVAHSKSFQEDPLRILRAFSFAYLLNFPIEKETLQLAKLHKDKLRKVSFERIRDELFKIFESDKASVCFRDLDKLKILEIIFPEIKKMRRIGQGPYHHLDVWQHTLETMYQLEIIFSGIKDIEIRNYLNQRISYLRRRSQLLKLGAFLHDIGKPATLRHENGRTTFHGHERAGLALSEDIAKRLKLSNDEMRALHKMVLWHLRPGYLADTPKPTERAKFRYFRDAGIEALGVLLLSLADQRATKGPLTTLTARRQHERVVSSLIREYLRKGKEKKRVRILNGDEVMKKFKLSPSPLIGKILSEVEELQAIGRIRNKGEAIRAVEGFLKKQR
jgi:poly(A) polymerase